MITVRALRLCKAQRLLPSLTRRSFASEANSTAAPSSESPPPSPGNSAAETEEAVNIIREISIPNSRPRNISRKAEGEKTSETYENTPSTEAGVKKKSWQDFQGALPQDPSNVYWALSDIYEVGGVIPRAKTRYHQLGEGNIPLWGEWGIRLQIRTFGGPYLLTIPNFWLRDNCRCTKCVNQDTMQRAFDTFAIPQDIMPRQVGTEKEGLSITWANDSHASLYPWDWIMKHRHGFNDGPLLDKDNALLKEPGPKPPILWGAKIAKNPPSVHYNEIMANDKGVAKWTEKIRRYGFCYVDGCPIDPAKTEELLQRIAFIRVTHYGGFYDFTSDLTMKDTAYTTLALPAHTDTTYFTDPAGLQMFHLLSHTSGTGGASLLVDGFHAASILKSECINSYNILMQTPIPWHASGNDGITITPSCRFPVLNYEQKAAGQKKELTQVRWNNDDRGVVALRAHESGGAGAERWYNAARKWDEILRRKDMEYWAQLEPGRPLIFDNWRVLHGRSAFNGKRRMCGGYINRDDYVSRWRNTNFGREEALRQIL